MNDNEIKTWRASWHIKVGIVNLLLGERIPFSYDPVVGIVFKAPEWYAKKIEKKFQEAYPFFSGLRITEIKESDNE